MEKIEEPKKYFFANRRLTREEYERKLTNFIQEREYTLGLEINRHEKAVRRIRRQLDEYQKELESIKGPEKSPLKLENNIVL